MSIATNASTDGQRRHSPARVGGSDVARSPRVVTTSAGGMSRWRTKRPARVRIPDEGDTATSTGSAGSRSRPDSQAALAPTNTASDGRSRRHADSVSHGSSRSPDQRYRPVPMRLQLLPLRARRLTPASRASSTVKGRRFSWGGTFGLLPTRAGCGRPGAATTQPVKPPDSVRPAQNPRLQLFQRCVLHKTHPIGPKIGPRIHASSLYPTPGSLTTYLGFAGSSPSFFRICATT